MNTCLVWGSTCRRSSMSCGKSLSTATAVSFSPSGASARYRASTAANNSGVSGKSSCRYLRAKTAAGPATVTMRSGFGRSRKVDPMKSTTACSEAPTSSYRADDGLNEVHRSFGALVQFDTEIRREIVDHEVAAGERLQHQDLPLDRLRRHIGGCPEREQASQSDAWE